jgi:muramoyltetrapeptide carboxypeptidase
MMDDPAVKAILCARGGYGTIRMISRLKFDGFTRHPKWIAGYSDITVLHAALQQCFGIESIHGPMPRFALPKKPDPVSFESLRGLLFGESSGYKAEPHTMNREGLAAGILVGGNLSVLYSIAGTEYEPDTSGKILFIEDLGEYFYHIDRMMMNLKIRGKLKGLKGLVVGDMIDMKGAGSDFRKPAYQVIFEAVKEYGFPVMFGFPAGHGVRNLALPMGREVEMVVGRECGVRW